MVRLGLVLVLVWCVWAVVVVGEPVDVEDGGDEGLVSDGLGKGSSEEGKMSAEGEVEGGEDDEYDYYELASKEDSGDSQLTKKLKEQVRMLKEEHKRDTKFQKELVAKLQDIRAELKELRAGVEDPKLSEWMLRRTEEIGTYLGSARVGEALESNLKKLFKRTMRLEQVLDKDLTQVVGTKYSSPLAQFLTFLLLALPASIIAYGIYRSYVIFSVRQYVLVGHLSNLIFVMSSLVLYGLLGRDPFGALIDAQHDVGVVLTQIWLALQYLSMLVLLLFALLASKTRFQRGCFLAQIVILLLVGMDYRQRIYLPVLQTNTPETSGVAGFIAYLLYTVAVIVMIVITVKTAKISRNETLVREVDAVISLFYPQADPVEATERPDGPESGNKEV